MAAISAAICFSLSPLHAATQQECLSLWKTADVDANGALIKSEDKAGYIAAAAQSGKPLQQADTLSRDEFLQMCADNVFAANAGAASPSPAAGRDMGKGDLTPAQNPLSEADARSKLEASGFREIQGLTLDKDSIWRGTALANGERQSVAVDAQGDIVAKSEAGAAPKSEAAPAAAAPMAKRNAEVPKEDSSMSAAVEGVERGTAGPGGLFLWTFLLIGNALALVLLSSMTSGGTSAMSSRRDASTFA
jgi:hypothetical protein